MGLFIMHYMTLEVIIINAGQYKGNLKALSFRF